MTDNYYADKLGKYDQYNYDGERYDNRTAYEFNKIIYNDFKYRKWRLDGYVKDRDYLYYRYTLTGNMETLYRKHSLDRNINDMLYLDRHIHREEEQAEDRELKLAFRTYLKEILFEETLEDVSKLFNEEDFTG